ncbi:SGNH/GDSL hydrolase family protein [Dyella sp. C9]|uniref:SGNH/GDSL hydrolase family protein n=1 Tax=Dyella sp. C9 TaxID=2202154 RepID=UPI000DEFB36B|nr:SGNH/GDSL hydrolase family protein [Dyella sp. C9]
MKHLNWRALATMLLLGALSFGARADGGPAHWQPSIDAFVTADRTHPPAPGGVLFIGSSSINFWKSLAQDFPGIPVINRGFGGSDLTDSTYFADRIVWPYKPRLIVMYAGENDINEGAGADQVLAAFQAFIARARQGVPGVPIVYISIKPSIARLSLWPTMQQANERIRAWAATQKNVGFVDVTPPMLDANGKPRPELFRADGLHMTPAGYALWIAALTPVLAAHGFVADSPAQ